jgi:leukotriene-A4 hydrolase
MLFKLCFRAVSYSRQVNTRQFATMHKAPAVKLQQPEPQDLTIVKHRDTSTLSNYHNFKTTNTSVDFRIDFDKQKLSGTVSLRLKSLTNAETNEIVLDSSFLDIQHVSVNGNEPEWDVLSSRIEPFGSPLSIKLKEGVPKDEHIQVDIKVSTTKDCVSR